MSCKVRKRRACSVSSVWFCSVFEIEWERERELGFRIPLRLCDFTHLSFLSLSPANIFWYRFFSGEFSVRYSQKFRFFLGVGTIWPFWHFENHGFLFKVDFWSLSSLFSLNNWIFFKADLLLLRRLSKNWCRWSWIGPFRGD